MRARNLKPSFFKNEKLADCQPLARLLFQGLWCMSDREGRMEYRPRKIKAEILPYDNCKIEKLISELSAASFITLYSVDDCKYLLINKFKEHQYPHIKEQISTIPAPDQNHTSMVPIRLNPESPILNPESPILILTLGEFTNVKLTEKELDALNEKFGEQGTKDRIEKLSCYIASKGKKYRSHYATILNWDRMQVKSKEELEDEQRQRIKAAYIKQKEGRNEQANV